MKKLLDGGTEHRMDLGCVTWNADGKTQKRHFLVSCGIGYDAAVCQEALDSPMKDALNKLGLGKLTYLGIGLKQMLTLQYCRASIRLDGREIIKAGKLLFAAGMIHRYEGGGFCSVSYTHLDVYKRQHPDSVKLSECEGDAADGIVLPANSFVVTRIPTVR